MRLARLDGIRGFAILMVFAHHVVNFKPGWVGVEVFFVLSGYLITTILRRERNASHFWSSFYIKRVTRIWPPLLVCFFLATLLVSFPWRQLGLYYVFFAANIAQAIHPLQGDKELTIIWSLAVEEQFYLLWPFAIRFCRRNTLLRILIGILCCEPILRGLFTPHLGWWQMYILTPFRLDGLAAGSLLAVLLEDIRWSERLKRISGPASAAVLVVYALCALRPEFSFRADSYSFNILGYTMVTIIATLGLAYTLVHEESRLSGWLSRPWIVFLGMISYGAYLYHPMVVNAIQKLVILIGFNHMRTVSPVTALITILLSWASFRFLEKPVVRWGQKRARELNHEAVPKGGTQQIGSSFIPPFTRP